MADRVGDYELLLSAMRDLLIDLTLGFQAEVSAQEGSGDDFYAEEDLMLAPVDRISGAPVGVHVDADDRVTVRVGSYGRFECSGPGERLHRQVAELIAAVLDGEVHEDVKVSWSGRVKYRIVIRRPGHPDLRSSGNTFVGDDPPQQGRHVYPAYRRTG